MQIDADQFNFLVFSFNSMTSLLDEYNNSIHIYVRKYCKNLHKNLKNLSKNMFSF